MQLTPLVFETDQLYDDRLRRLNRMLACELTGSRTSRELRVG
jgi:hypothetical protein